MRIAASVTIPVDPHFASQVVLWETKDRVSDLVFLAPSAVVGTPISNAGRHLDPISSYHIYKFRSESKRQKIFDTWISSTTHLTKLLDFR